jgi:hypothetical protein
MDPYCSLVIRFTDKLSLKSQKVLLGCMSSGIMHDANSTS